MNWNNHLTGVLLAGCVALALTACDAPTDNTTHSPDPQAAATPRPRPEPEPEPKPADEPESVSTPPTSPSDAIQAIPDDDLGAIVSPGGAEPQPSNDTDTTTTVADDALLPEDHAEPQTYVQKFIIDGKKYLLSNLDENAEEDIRVGPEGELIYVHSIGDVRLVTGDLTIDCHDLEYKAQDGVMTAQRWKDKQVVMEQGNGVSTADKLINDTNAKRTTLIGQARVLQTEPTKVTDTRGKTIIRDEGTSGAARVRVIGDPFMKHRTLDDPSTTTAAADAATTQGSAQIETFENSIGDNFDLKADEQSGEFDMYTNELGELTSFTATNGVVLKSDKMDLESDFMKILDGGKSVYASGEQVDLRQNDVKAKCREFYHYPDDKKTILIGDPTMLAEIVQDGNLQRGRKIEIQDVEYQGEIVTDIRIFGRPQAADQGGANDGGAQSNGDSDNAGDSGKREIEESKEKDKPRRPPRRLLED